MRLKWEEAKQKKKQQQQQQQSESAADIGDALREDEKRQDSGMFGSVFNMFSSNDADEDVAKEKDDEWKRHDINMQSNVAPSEVDMSSSESTFIRKKQTDISFDSTERLQNTYTSNILDSSYSKARQQSALSETSSQSRETSSQSEDVPTFSKQNASREPHTDINDIRASLSSATGADNTRPALFPERVDMEHEVLKYKKETNDDAFAKKRKELLQKREHLEKLRHSKPDTPDVDQLRWKSRSLHQDHHHGNQDHHHGNQDHHHGDHHHGDHHSNEKKEHD